MQNEAGLIMGATNPVPPAVIASVDPDLAAEWPETLSLQMLEPLLNRSIWNGKAAVVAKALLALDPGALDADARALAAGAASACAAIAEANRGERDRMTEVLRSAGAVVTGASTDPAPQSHSFALEVAAEDMPTAVAAARKEGYVDLEPAGSWQPNRDLFRADAPGMRMTLHRRARSGLISRTISRLRRIGRPDTGPYLATPTDLIPLLLDKARVTSNDVVMDLGCGDGRVLVEAARSRRCRAIGMELSTSLVDMANTRVSEESLGDLVTIVAGDLGDADFTDVTVVFAFLPMRHLVGLVPDLLSRLEAGSRILAHEQTVPDRGIRPDSSHPVIGPASLTVAHMWSVPQRPQK